MADQFAGVDPQLIPHAQAMTRLFADLPRLSFESLPQWRSADFGHISPAAATVSVKPVAITSQSGNDVLVYVVNGRPGADRPAIVNMHGGGFVLGSARQQLSSLINLALRLDISIVSVEYRLAPEAIWSQSLEDNYAALLWTYASGSALGIDRTRIAVMGGSAGGGHAALLAITARDRGEVEIVLQALLYPMLDDRTGSSRRMPDHLGRLVWNAADNEFGWSAFLGQDAGSRRVPTEAVPARISDLAGLPPAFIGVGGLDLFVEESVEYARRLLVAGVATELHVTPGGFHGFDGADAQTSRQFRSLLENALIRGLGL